MDLYSIVRSLWRHKFATLPLVILTFAGCAAVVLLKAPTYTTTANYILSPPPAAPTATQIAQDPALGKVNTNNPFLNYGGLPVVAQELTTILSTDQAKANLTAQGAVGSYTVAPSQLFGNGTPLIQVTALATTPAAAIATSNLVGKELASEMNSMQVAQGVVASYRISTLPVTAPSPPVLAVSGKLRDLIAVFAIGMMMIFVVVSILNALDERTLRRREARAVNAAGGIPLGVESGHASTDGRNHPRAAGWLVAPDSSVSELEGGQPEEAAERSPAQSATQPLRMGVGRRRSS